MSKTDSGTSRTVREGRKVPYVLAIPALAFMFVFFVVPIISLLKSSLSNKPNRLIPHYDFTWEWSNYRLAYDRFLGHFERSFLFAGLATLLCIVIAYPVAYFIAFKVGKWRNVLLGLVMVPFFTSFLLRTLAWQSLLALVPALAGMGAGQFIRSRISPATFKACFFAGLLALGAYLCWRSLA